MKKFAIIVFVLGLLFLIFGCSKRTENRVQLPRETNWQIEVSYLDNIKDTLYITTPYSDCDCSSDEPEIETYNGVSTLRLDYKDIASYVKSFRVLTKDQIK